MSAPNPTHIIAEHHAEHGDAGSQQVPGCRCGWQGEVLEHPPWHPIPGVADTLHAAHVVSRLADAGYSIVPSGTIPYVRVSETFTDDDGILRDSQNGDIVSTFDWPTLDSIPVGVTRVGSQIGRVAALSPIAGWYWADGEGFPEVDGYNGPWCEVAP